MTSGMITDPLVIGTTTPAPPLSVRLHPLGDAVILEAVESPVADASKVYRVSRDPEGPTYARVVEVGPGRFSEYTGALVPMPDIMPGDVLLVGAGVGMPFTIGADHFRLIFASSRDAWCKITTAAA